MPTWPSWQPARARGPLFAGLRDAEARGLDVEAVVPQLVAGKSLADAGDVASVLHGRIERWSHAAGGRRRHTGHLIAGLIPRAQGVTDPDMARALAERDQAMEQRALSLAEEAITARHRWLRPLGAPPSGVSPAGTLVASSVNCRGLPGSLAHRGSPSPRRNSGSRKHGTNVPAQEGAGGGGAGEGDQHRGNGTADQSRAGGRCRDCAGDRTLRDFRSGAIRQLSRPVRHIGACG